MDSIETKIDRLKRENRIVQAMNEALAAEGAVLKAVYSMKVRRRPGASGSTVVLIGPKPSPAPAKEDAKVE